MTATHARSHDRSGYIDVKTSGFVVRKRTPITRITNFFMVLSIFVFIISVAYYNDSMVGLFLCVGGGLLVLFLAIQLEAMQKMQQSTEFMNAVFSSALGKYRLFCIVVRGDGELVYMNRPFQSNFPHFIDQEHLNIRQWLTMQHAPQEDAEKFYELVASGTDSSITMTMSVGEKNEQRPVSISIDAIDRPKGFVLIRGK